MSEQAPAPRASRERPGAKYREPIEVAPFLAWCAWREEQIRRDLDNLPGLRSIRFNDDARRRLVAEIGWDGETGMRRLLRWEHENSGLAERADIEDALHHAGVDFHDIYPDEPAHDRGVPSRVGQGRRITDKQLLAVHVLYERRGLSLRELGELLWQQFGYANPESCAWQIRRGFHNLGLPVRDPVQASIAVHLKHGRARNGQRSTLYRRYLALTRHGQCAATRADGTPCPRAAHPGTRHCGYHQPDELARRKAQIAQINAHRAPHQEAAA